MSGFYNAVIRDNLKIVGRTHLTLPKNVPWWWEIKDFEGKKIITAVDLGGIIDPEKPLQITQRETFRERPKGTDSTEVEFDLIFPFNRRNIILKVNPSNYVQDVVWMVCREKEVDEFCLCNHLFGGQELDSKLGAMLADLGVNAQNNRIVLCSTKSVRKHSDVLFARHTKIEHEKIAADFNRDECRRGMRKKLRETVYPKMKRRPIARMTIGTPKLNFGNLDGNRDMMRGVGNDVKPENYWRSYAAGLNLKGNCDNPKCLSRKFKSPDMVVVTVEINFLKLTPSTNFDCTACGGEGTFKPSNFLLSGMRCAFWYKITGERVIKIVTLGSDAPYPKYAMLKNQNDKKEYDWIEIRTVPWDKSPHDCNMCGKPIGKREIEMTSNLRDCVHHWHRSCRPQEECAYCTAFDIWETGLGKFCAEIERN